MRDLASDYMHSNPGLQSCVTLGTLPDLSLSYFSHCQHKGNITAHAIEGLPRWHSGKEPTCQCRRHKRPGFSPRVRKIPWRREWQLTPVPLPEKFHGQRSLVATVHGVPDMTGLLKIHTHATEFLWKLSERKHKAFLKRFWHILLLLQLSHFNRVRLCVTP